MPFELLMNYWDWKWFEANPEAFRLAFFTISPEVVHKMTNVLKAFPPDYRAIQGCFSLINSINRMLNHWKVGIKNKC
jgi:hypothetical protein